MFADKALYHHYQTRRKHFCIATDVENIKTAHTEWNIIMTNILPSIEKIGDVRI